MADHSDAESLALLDYLGHMHGNETREETIARLQSALKFAKAEDKPEPAKKTRRSKRARS
jgi:hypothetical protein